MPQAAPLAFKDRSIGLEELRHCRNRDGRLYVFVALFSFFLNLLMLTGPMFMMQVYDRVLGSKSLETLSVLILLVGFLYLVAALLDGTRQQILSRIGARFEHRLGERTSEAFQRLGVSGQAAPHLQNPLQDLGAIRNCLASPAVPALFDLPWVPVFLAGLMLFHPALGIFALLGGAVLVAMTLTNRWLTARRAAGAQEARARAERLGEEIGSSATALLSLGMRQAATARWKAASDLATDQGLVISDRTATFSAAARAWRLFLQSGMLALGAYLVLRGDLGAGAMIASTILLGRALVPVEQLVAHWPGIARARLGWLALADLFAAFPTAPHRHGVSPRDGALDVRQISVVPPPTSVATLRMVSFQLEAGQALGVIGPSGAGKTTLAMALTGLWPPAAGQISIGGVPLSQIAPEQLGRSIGYLPQSVRLFDGTIAENIACLSRDPSIDAVIAAARSAAAHDMILTLPAGYDTEVSSNDQRLSGGQVQRIGLARAFFGDPALILLDEPNASLDNEGSMALNAAVRQAKTDGRAVIVMAHRPAAIQECDLLLMLDNGVRTAFGPKSEVLKNVVRNFRDLERPQQLGGVA